MSGLVVDASVVIKWVVGEAGSEEASRLIGRPGLLAPDLLIPECANILWKKVRRGELGPDEADMAATLLQRAAIELVGTRALMAEALRLAVRLDHPAYDCTYLALAMARGVPLATADDRLRRTVSLRGGGALAGLVRSPAEAAGPA